MVFPYLYERKKYFLNPKKKRYSETFKGNFCKTVPKCFIKFHQQLLEEAHL